MSLGLANRSFILMIMAYMTLSPLARADIDRDNESAREDNAYTLSAVVHIQSETTSCTATLIRKDVLLTAAHCFSIFAKGSKFFINQEAHKVLDFKIHPLADQTVLLESDTNKKLDPAAVKLTYLHDLALVRFDLRRLSTLTKLARLDVAKEKAQHSGSAGKVLMGGYGYTFEGSGAHTATSLRAGFNSFLVSDYVPAAMTAQREQFRMYLKPGAGLDKMIGKKTRIMTLVGKKGQAFKDTSLSDITIADKNSVVSLPLPGDSGSPAISFLSNGAPEIVAVDSRMSLYGVGNAQISVNSEQGFSKFSIPDLSVKEIRPQLIRLGLMSSEKPYKLLSDLVIHGTRRAIQTADYVSVFEATNRAFIDDTLKQFEN